VRRVLFWYFLIWDLQREDLSKTIDAGGQHLFVKYVSTGVINKLHRNHAVEYTSVHRCRSAKTTKLKSRPHSAHWRTDGVRRRRQQPVESNNCPHDTRTMLSSERVNQFGQVNVLTTGWTVMFIRRHGAPGPNGPWCVVSWLSFPPNGITYRRMRV